MSLLKAIVHSVVSAYDPVLGVTWSDIAIANPTISGTNEDNLIEWDLGLARTYVVAYYGTGAAHYRLDSGPYVQITGGWSGTSFSISSGQTLGFKYATTANINETRYITVFDSATGVYLDSFNVSYSGGTDGGIGGGDGSGGEGGGEGELD